MSLDQAKEAVSKIQANQGAFKQPAKAVEDNNHPKVVNTMTELFTRLKAITAVGNAFNSESEHIVKQEWVLAFALEGIKSQVVIDRGVEAMRIKARKSRGTTWFPSIGEFVDACLGSEDKLKFATRAYDLFITREKQIDSVGLMVVSKHSFDLRSMKAAEGKKRFIELYLEFAENNEITPLEAFALTHGVTLTDEQKLDAQKRTGDARASFFANFGSIATPEKEQPRKAVKTGVTIGKIKTGSKPTVQEQKEKDRQLKLAKKLMEKKS